jgi:hypothetical protein
VFPELLYSSAMASWSFLTNHARTLLCIAHDPGVRFRDIAVEVDITERSAHGIVDDLVDAGYLVKQKTGRRNRYRIQAHLPEVAAAAGNRFVGDDTPPNSLATGWWACPALGHSGRSTKNVGAEPWLVSRSSPKPAST